MATNRHVSIAKLELEELLRNKGNPHTKLRFDELGEELTSKILEMYDELVNKPTIIAEKLIETIQLDYDSEEDRLKVDNERKRAWDILETITDIDTINEIRSIITHKKGQKYYTRLAILNMIYHRINELITLENSKKRLKILKSQVKLLENKLSTVCLKRREKSIQLELKLAKKSKQSKSDNEEDEKIYFIKTEISRMKEDAKKILTRAHLKTLNWYNRDKIIEKTVDHFADNVLKTDKLLNELLS